MSLPINKPLDLNALDLIVTPATVTINELGVSNLKKSIELFLKTERDLVGTVSRENRTHVRELKDKMGKSFLLVEAMRKKAKAEINAPYEVLKKELDGITGLFLAEKEIYSKALHGIDGEDKDEIEKLFDKAISVLLKGVDEKFILPIPESLVKKKRLLGSITGKGELTASSKDEIDIYIESCLSLKKLHDDRLLICKSEGLSTFDVKDFILDNEFDEKLESFVERRKEVEAKAMGCNDAILSVEEKKIDAIVDYHLREGTISEGVVKLESNSNPLLVDHVAKSMIRLTIKPKERVIWGVTIDVELEFKGIGTQSQIEGYVKSRMAQSLQAIQDDLNRIRVERQGFYVSAPSLRINKTGE